MANNNLKLFLTSYVDGSEPERMDKNKRKSREYWENWENVENEIINFIEEHKLDDFPSQKHLNNNGRSNIGAAISKYHGGFREFRRSMGEEQVKEKEGAWKSLEFTIEKAVEFLENNLEYDILPGQWTLIKTNEGGRLARSIQKYHGGFLAFREKLKEYIGQPSEENQLEFLLNAYVGGLENE